MPRYIDADAFIKKLEADIKEFGEPNINIQPIAYGSVLGIESALDLAKELPTADVVPKSEVEKANAEIERLKKYNTDVAFKHYNDGKADAASEIFAEIYEDCFDEFGYINYEALAELKKKYTEGDQ